MVGGMSAGSRQTRRGRQARGSWAVLKDVVASVFARGDTLIQRRLRRRSPWEGGWEWSGTASSSGALNDLLMFAVLASLAGEVASIFANKTILASVFFLTTLFWCVVVWKRNG